MKAGTWSRICEGMLFTVSLSDIFSAQLACLHISSPPARDGAAHSKLHPLLITNISHKCAQSGLTPEVPYVLVTLGCLKLAINTKQQKWFSIWIPLKPRLPLKGPQIKLETKLHFIFLVHKFHLCLCIKNKKFYFKKKG